MSSNSDEMLVAALREGGVALQERNGSCSATWRRFNDRLARELFSHADYLEGKLPTPDERVPTDAELEAAIVEGMARSAVAAMRGLDYQRTGSGCPVPPEVGK